MNVFIGKSRRPCRIKHTSGGSSVYFTYIIRERKTHRYYVGYSHDPEIRLRHHNQGWTRSTKNGQWELVYVEKFVAKSEALEREREIKRMKSRSYIEGLIKSIGGRPDERVHREVPSAPPSRKSSL